MKNTYEKMIDEYAAEVALCGLAITGGNDRAFLSILAANQEARATMRERLSLVRKQLGALGDDTSIVVGYSEAGRRALRVFLQEAWEDCFYKDTWGVLLALKYPWLEREESFLRGAGGILSGLKKISEATMVKVLLISPDGAAREMSIIPIYVEKWEGDRLMGVGTGFISGGIFTQREDIKSEVVRAGGRFLLGKYPYPNVGL